MESYEESYVEAPVKQNGKSDDSAYSGMGIAFSAKQEQPTHIYDSGEEDEQLHLEAQNPHGDAVLERLVVRVYRARNLRAADANGLSDPYVTVRAVDTEEGMVSRQQEKRQKFRTPYILNTLTPDWFHEEADERHYQGVLDVHGSTRAIKINCKDYDAFSSSDDLGVLEISLDQIAEWAHGFSQAGQVVRPAEDATAAGGALGWEEGVVGYDRAATERLFDAAEAGDATTFEHLLKSTSCSPHARQPVVRAGQRANRSLADVIFGPRYSGTAKGRRLICEQLGAAGYREPLSQHAESQGFVATREVNTARLHGAVRKVVPLTYRHESDQQRLDRAGIHGPPPAPPKGKLVATAEASFGCMAARRAKQRTATQADGATGEVQPMAEVLMEFGFLSNLDYNQFFVRASGVDGDGGGKRNYHDKENDPPYQFDPYIEGLNQDDLTKEPDEWTLEQKKKFVDVDGAGLQPYDDDNRDFREKLPRGVVDGTWSTLSNVWSAMKQEGHSHCRGDDGPSVDHPRWRAAISQPWDPADPLTWACVPTVSELLAAAHLARAADPARRPAGRCWLCRRGGGGWAAARFKLCLARHCATPHASHSPAAKALIEATWAHTRNGDRDIAPLSGTQTDSGILLRQHQQEAEKAVLRSNYERERQGRDKAGRRLTLTTLGVAAHDSLAYGYKANLKEKPKTSRLVREKAPLLGVITLTIGNCAHLPKMDTLGNLCDPYVVGCMGQYLCRTVVKTSTLDPHWAEEEATMMFPVTSPSDELHLMVFDFDAPVAGLKVDHDPVGRIWPGIYARDLPYGQELHYENVPLYDLHKDKPYYDSTDEKKRSRKITGSKGSLHQNTRGFISLRLRYDIVDPSLTGLERTSAMVRAKARIWGSYLNPPRVPSGTSSAPIELQSNAVRQTELSSFRYIPETSFIHIRRGTADGFGTEVNYTVDSEGDGENVEPWKGAKHLNGLIERVQKVFAPPLQGLGKSITSVLKWHYAPKTMMWIYLWTYFVLCNNGHIVGFLAACLALSLLKSAWKVWRDGVYYERAEGGRVSDGSGTEYLPWHKYEDDLIDQYEHRFLQDDPDRWHKIAEAVSKGIAGTTRNAEECKMRFESMQVMRGGIDSDSEPEIDSEPGSSEEGSDDDEGERGEETSSGSDTEFDKGHTILNRTGTTAKKAAARIKNKMGSGRDPLEVALRLMGQKRAVSKLQLVQNTLGFIAIYGEKVKAICTFQDVLQSTMFLMVVIVAIPLLFLVPTNWIIWGIGFFLMLKGGPIKGLGREIKRYKAGPDAWFADILHHKAALEEAAQGKVHPTEREYEQSMKAMRGFYGPKRMGLYWYMRHMKQHPEQVHKGWPERVLSEPLDFWNDFIWHAPSRTRIASPAALRAGDVTGFAPIDTYRIAPRGRNLRRRAVAKTLAKEGGITAAELCVELRCVAPGGAWAVDTQETCSITRPVKEYELGDRLHTTSAYHHEHLGASRVPCADGWSEPQPGACRPQYGVRSVCLSMEPSERAEPRGRGRSLADGAERHPALRAA